MSIVVEIKNQYPKQLIRSPPLQTHIVFMCKKEEEAQGNKITSSGWCLCWPEEKHIQIHMCEFVPLFHINRKSNAFYKVLRTFDCVLRILCGIPKE